MHSGHKRQSKSGAGKGQRGVGGAGAPPSTGYHLIGLPLSVSAGGRSAAISQKREGSLIGRSCIDRPRPPAQEVHRGGTWHLLDGRSLACISGNVSGRPAPDTAGILQPRSTRHKTSGALPHVAVVDFQSIFVGLRRFRFSVAASPPGIRLRAPGPRTLEYGSGMKTHPQGKPPIVPQTAGHRGQTPDGSQISVTVVRHRLAPHRFPSTAILAHPSSPTRDLLADCLAVAPPPARRSRVGRGEAGGGGGWKEMQGACGEEARGDED